MLNDLKEEDRLHAGREEAADERDDAQHGRDDRDAHEDRQGALLEGVEKRAQEPRDEGRVDLAFLLWRGDRGDAIAGDGAAAGRGRLRGLIVARRSVGGCRRDAAHGFGSEGGRTALGGRRVDAHRLEVGNRERLRVHGVQAVESVAEAWACPEACACPDARARVEIDAEARRRRGKDRCLGRGRRGGRLGRGRRRNDPLFDAHPCADAVEVAEEPFGGGLVDVALHDHRRAADDLLRRVRADVEDARQLGDRIVLPILEAEHPDVEDVHSPRQGNAGAGADFNCVSQLVHAPRGAGFVHRHRDQPRR